MSNSKFDKNGIDNSGTHWLQYAAFVITAFFIYFGWLWRKRSLDILETKFTLI